MATTTWGPHPGRKPNNIATKGTNGIQRSKKTFKSKLEKYGKGFALPDLYVGDPDYFAKVTKLS